MLRSEFRREMIESYFKYQKMRPRIRFQISKGKLLQIPKKE